MKTTPLTLARLNDIFAQWMKLDPFASKEDSDRVIELMKELPRRYLVIPHGAPDTAAITYDGGPLWARPRALADAIAYAEANDVQTRFAWRTDGQWVEVPQPLTPGMRDDAKVIFPNEARTIIIHQPDFNPLRMESAGLRHFRVGHKTLPLAIHIPWGQTVAQVHARLHKMLKRAGSLQRIRDGATA